MSMPYISVDLRAEASGGVDEQTIVAPSMVRQQEPPHEAAKSGRLRPRTAGGGFTTETDIDALNVVIGARPIPDDRHVVARLNQRNRLPADSCIVGDARLDDHQYAHTGILANRPTSSSGFRRRARTLRNRQIPEG